MSAAAEGRHELRVAARLTTVDGECANLIDT